MRHLLLIFFLLSVSVSLSAQRPRRVSAEYTYVSSDKNETPKQAIEKAVLQARYEAIRREFGERVTNQTDYIASRNDSNEIVTFHQHGGTELKAEWIETIKEEVRDQRFENGFWVVTVRVEGRAQEIASAGMDFEYHILRNGTELRHEEKNFKNGDYLYLMFKSPVDGYLSVYVVDDKTAYCTLPYQEQTNGIYNVRANQQYIFFSDKHLQEGEDSYNVTLKTIATIKAGVEVNEIYIIFSTQPFTKKTDNAGLRINEKLSFARNIETGKFMDWLSMCRKRDSHMKVEKSTITISNN